ncbi:MAG: hypothetical protein O7C75_14045 [Verrucomicrobia bacterium]|nr:hypothetical protein [Verrucomicrobiota bacterium]
MKGFLQFLLILIPILLGGCASQLSVSQHGKSLAPRLGVKDSDIKYLSYGDFIAKIEFKDLKVVTLKGVVVLTDDELCLVARHNKHLFSKEFSTYSYADMNGVSKIASQIHIPYGDDTIVLEFDPVYDGYVNPEEVENVYQLIAQAGVPTYEVTELTDIPRYTGRYYPGKSGRSRAENYQRNSQRNQPNWGDSFYNQDLDRYWR